MKDEYVPPYPHDYEGNAVVALFRTRRMFAAFVDGFVEVGNLKGRLQFERAQLLERTFTTEILRAGARDILWQVPCAGGPTPVVFLIEHQSGVDHEMPDRIFDYMHALWQDYRARLPRSNRRAKGHQRVPILPVVFYTGPRPWTGVRRLNEVIGHGAELSRFVPNFEFQIVDVARLADEDLARPGNWARTVMHLVWAFIHGLKKEKFFEILREFQPFWVRPRVDQTLRILYHYSRAERRAEVARRLFEMLDPEEAAMSAPEVVGKRFWEVWWEEGLAKGKAEGLAKGKAEGLAKGEAEGLQQQLEAIRQLFERRGLDWPAYENDVRSLPSIPEATRFMVDLATAPDMAAFLRERFGH